MQPAGRARARAALDRILASERCDVILSELMMPRTTRIDVDAELSHLAPDQAARIVFLTGGAFTPNARAFLDQVPNQRIEKPFDTQMRRDVVASRAR